MKWAVNNRLNSNSKKKEILLEVKQQLEELEHTVGCLLCCGCLFGALTSLVLLVGFVLLLVLK